MPLPHAGGLAMRRIGPRSSRILPQRGLDFKLHRLHYDAAVARLRQPASVLDEAKKRQLEHSIRAGSGSGSADSKALR